EGPESLVDGPAWVGADGPVGAMRDHDRAICGVAEGETGHPKDGGFFLNTPGIGQDHASAAHESDTVVVTKWVETADAFAGGGLPEFGRGQNRSFCWRSCWLSR